jgi:hypothetical protein
LPFALQAKNPWPVFNGSAETKEGNSFKLCAEKGHRVPGYVTGYAYPCGGHRVQLLWVEVLPPEVSCWLLTACKAYRRV